MPERALLSLDGPWRVSTSRHENGHFDGRQGPTPHSYEGSGKLQRQRTGG